MYSCPYYWHLAVQRGACARMLLLLPIIDAAACSSCHTLLVTRVQFANNTGPTCLYVRFRNATQSYSVNFRSATMTAQLLARCTRSVSIPPAVYYSHLVAFRAQHFLKDESESESELSTTTGAAAARDISKINWADKLHAVQSELRKVMYFI
eukprot:3910-Heterococcus_DN1.PRE.1